MQDNRYLEYLKALNNSYQKLAKLEFLQPDNSVAFSLDNNYKRGYSTKFDRRAFIQSGSLSVNLQNGARRKASITLANLDSEFDFAINKLWYGQRVRLSMGLVLPDGTEFYLPQGVFYLSNPQTTISPNQKTINYSLVDKWSYLDGSLFGRLENSYQVNRSTQENPSNIFNAMQTILSLSRKDFSNNAEDFWKIDNVLPVFTDYYNGKYYTLKDGTLFPITSVPYNVIAGSADGGTFAEVLLELNTIIAGWIGYDCTGALRVDASQDDINDGDKPILWAFTPENSLLFGINETYKNSEVANDIKISGENLTGGEVWGRVQNFDPASETNINIIGDRLYKENRAEYWNAGQCVDLAKFYLKRKTVLQKSVSVKCQQMFHLQENSLITIKRTDKQGSPTEKHLIQSFTVPISTTGDMQIQAVSVNDINLQNIVVTSSDTENS